MPPLLRDSGALQRGSLKIGAVGPFHVTEMIEAYHALHPHMHLSVALGNSETVLRDLDQYVRRRRGGPRVRGHALLHAATRVFR